MKYFSTRGGAEPVSGLEAIIKGLADDGGLYVPEKIPTLDKKVLDKLPEMDYADIAAAVLAEYLPELSKDELKSIFEKSSEKFEDGTVAPVVKVSDGLFFLELWHGPTLAFKDAALTVLPHLINAAREKLNVTDKIFILTATSGDTGKAALAGFQDAPDIKIAVLYPSEGVSLIQKLQMQTQEGENVQVAGIEGNFDDAQTAVKKIFADKEIAENLKECGYILSSANSINLGRLLPQIVYYFSTYAALVASGEIEADEKINFAVPSGNFGNILAGFYARKMGLPIGKLICASNQNNVLTDFFDTGTYDCNREFFKTTSPSMDILISSNLERLVFELVGRDCTKTAELMKNLSDTGRYAISESQIETAREAFYGDMCPDFEALEAISNLFESEGYVCDPHTAVALSANSNYIAETGDESVSVVVSTASPYKFAEDVLRALDEKPGKDIEKTLINLREVSALPIPEQLYGAINGEVRFDKVLPARGLHKELEKLIVRFSKNR